MARIICFAASILLLAGCNTTRSVIDRPEFARIPASLLSACRGVVSIPDRDLAAREALRLWATDRAALGECARRHSGLAASLKAIMKQGR